MSNVSAFPRPPQNGIGGAHGMTLRDYLAGQALIPVLSRWGSHMEGPPQEAVAARCYQIADAMLAVREK
jgi:hypothetical protein